MAKISLYKVCSKYHMPLKQQSKGREKQEEEVKGQMGGQKGHFFVVLT